MKYIFRDFKMSKLVIPGEKTTSVTGPESFIIFFKLRLLASGETS
jgi:hypothetical protein